MSTEIQLGGVHEKRCSARTAMGSKAGI